MKIKEAFPYQLCPVIVMQLDTKNLIKKEIDIISEYNLIVSLNEEVYICLTSCGLYSREFVIGYLISEGFIKKPGDISSIDINVEDGQINCSVVLDTSYLKKIVCSNLYYSGSMREITEAGHKNYTHITHTPNISLSALYKAFDQFLCQSNLHKMTRGVHSAALLTEQMEPLFFSDEIGRHNAIDQIIGMTYMQKISFEDKVLFFTGRLPSKIIKKIIGQKIPLVVSRGMPTSLGILLADQYKVTIISRLFKRSVTLFTCYNNNNITW
ncbi:MAG: formate dehydrogenase accessory sulfurtransferase FdhD [bacterium]